jgi:predicted transglutaminase-like cysteine proteinase
MKKINLAFALVLLALSSAQAVPLTGWVERSYVVTVPLWNSYVQTHPTDAQRQLGKSGSLSDLQAVTVTVNRASAPARLPVGPILTWRLWPLHALCGDYAVTKRHILLAMGWPSAAVRILIGRAPRSSALHAVLLVTLANGRNVILDNRTDALPTPDQEPYQWVLVQSRQDPNHWQAYSN